jgi:hypothetical protein
MPQQETITTTISVVAESAGSFVKERVSPSLRMAEVIRLSLWCSADRDKRDQEDFTFSYRLARRRDIVDFALRRDDDPNTIANHPICDRLYVGARPVRMQMNWHELTDSSAHGDFSHDVEVSAVTQTSRCATRALSS